MRGFIDLRALTARVLQRSSGGIEPGARALGCAIADDAEGPNRLQGRAGQMLFGLEQVLGALLARVTPEEAATPAPTPA